ncbi:unnamed protein product, partial [Prorocentrum cordatum]
RAQKLQRLNSIRHELPHVSKRALAAFCSKSRRDELPYISSTRDVRAARDMDALQLTPYGPTIVRADLEMKDGRRFTPEVVNPLAYLYAAAKCQRFADILEETYSRSPCSVSRPWGLVFYSDECKPGNKLKQLNKRAVQNVYFSVLDFGPWVLCKEDMWLCLASARALDISQCEGGMAQLMGALLRLTSHDGHDLRLAGITLDLPSGRSLRIHAKISCLLGDESGLHSMWMSKGSSGVKPCLHCANVVNKGWVGADFMEGSMFKDYTQVRSLRECVPHTKETIVAMIDRLAADAGVVNKGTLAERERLYGWTHSRHNMLNDRVLRPLLDPARQNTYDWAHNILQGLFQQTTFKLMKELRTSNITAAHIHSYFESFVFPRRLSSKGVTGQEMFCKKRAKTSWEAECFKCSASEALSAHSVLAHYCRTEVMARGLHVPACTAFVSLSVVIHMLFHGHKVGLTSDVLEAATSHFAKNWTAAFGTSDILWKFHGMLHHSEYIDRYGFCPHTLTVERKHKTVLKYAEDFTEDTSPVIREVLSESFHRFSHADWLDLSARLLGATMASKKLAGFLDATLGQVEHKSSSRARFNKYDVCFIGDFVALREGLNAWSLVRVIFLASSAGVCFGAVQPYARISQDVWSSCWQEHGDAFLTSLDDFLEVLICRESGGITTALHTLSLAK